METAKERRESYKIYCPQCGKFLLETRQTASSMICSYCRREIVAQVKNGKILLFVNRRKRDLQPEQPEQKMSLNLGDDLSWD